MSCANPAHNTISTTPVWEFRNANAITKFIGVFIAADLRPFSVVDKQAFFFNFPLNYEPATMLPIVRRSRPITLNCRGKVKKDQLVWIKVLSEAQLGKQQNQAWNYLFAVHLDVCNVVLKHCGDVDLRELVLTEDDEETGLTTRSVPHNHQLFPDGCHLKINKNKNE